MTEGTPHDPLGAPFLRWLAWAQAALRTYLLLYVTHISASEGQVGAVFAIDGKIEGMELFDHSETLAKLLPKLVRSYALDAIEVASSAGDKSGNDDAQAILDQCGSAEVTRFEAIGEGEDLRLSSSRIAGAALVSDGQIVHLCGFASEL